MEALKVGFWLRLGLLVITSLIVVNYFFESADNQCQMTFMMEPPKFIPIPIQNSMQHSLTSPGNSETHNYKLFMYSEFGFPLENNVRRDLKDSMPILFIPGNAGSYQQVRSLASTCIRRQLQSLDAFKFIFYTIDFKAQLSGIDGDLIERQIKFVQLAIKKIIEMHPTETNGVIVVGHSVGGFIAKALLTQSDFDPKSIPLLINLASPSTRPFLNFDSRMFELYNSTNNSWDQRRNTLSTLSISISGGTSDRLVPMQLSLDPQFDLSLTTSSIDNVWLTTDHVSITWCRELMTKLAQLLSALMDKKETRLIDNKEKQIAIVMEKLVTSASNQIDIISELTGSEQTIIGTGSVLNFPGFYVASRNALIDSPIILNMTDRKQADLFVWIEHIETFRKNCMFGCHALTLNNDRANCVEKIDLSSQMRTIPSRRYELKKKSFFIRDESHKMNYLIMDFTTNPMCGELKKDKIPESIFVQSFDEKEMKTLYVPTLLEYFIHSLWNSNLLTHKIVSNQKQQLTYVKYELTNINRFIQYFSIMIESKSCATSDKTSEITALLTQDDIVGSSFHPKKDKPFVIVKLSAQKFIHLYNQSSDSSKTHMELFISGSCLASLTIQLDLWSFIQVTIQSHLSKILSCACLLSYLIITLRSCSITRPVTAVYRQWFHITITALWLFLVRSSDDIVYFGHDVHDDLANIATVFVLAYGLIVLIEYSINRLVDLAIIVNNFHMFIRKRVTDHVEKKRLSENGSQNQNGNSSKKINAKLSRFDYEWLVIVMTTVGSSILSVALTKLCIFFMLLKLNLRVSLSKSSPSREFDEEKSSMINNIQMLIVNMTALSTLGLICNIPTALLKINSMNMFAPIDSIFTASLISLIAVKITCGIVESFMDGDVRENSKFLTSLSGAESIFGLLAMSPIGLLKTNIRLITYLELIMYVDILFSIVRFEAENKKKKT